MWRGIISVSNQERLAKFSHEKSTLTNDYIQTQKDYVIQFVQRVDDLLQAVLFRESMRDQKCPNCPMNNWSAWRCIDCTMSKALCRTCMRHSHQLNPLHRIEHWTGTHFRPAALWEVGTYIRVDHRDVGHACSYTEVQDRHLEAMQLNTDKAEQCRLSQPDPAPPAPSEPHMPMDVDNGRSGEQSIAMTWDEERIDDDIFFTRLESVLGPDGGDAEGDDDDAIEEDEEEGLKIPRYLGDADIAEGSRWSGTGSGLEEGPAGIPTTDAFCNSYVRVVHTNGVHHLALLSCPCKGQHEMIMDLVASNLVPASFDRIRTLFSAAVLDHFRLCNLELKASAYQFYQLTRRLTNPMSPASVPDLYHGFRRMTRLWRWMKKLKWAGYGHNKQDPQHPPPAALTIFCPACPQPGINLPAKWKTDKCRQGEINCGSQ